MNKRVVLAGVALAIVAALLWALIAQDTSVSTDPEPEPAPVAAAPRPDPTAAVQRGIRATVPRPEGIPEPEWPEERPPPSIITPDDKRKMNYAVDDVLRDAREECILPWIDDLDEPVEAEFVIDAVLWDGQLYEAGIRSLNLEIPQQVMDCVGDKVWIREWPTWELNGELRLQRQIKYRNEAMMPPPVDMVDFPEPDPDDPDAAPEEPPEDHD